MTRAIKKAFSNRDDCIELITSTSSIPEPHPPLFRSTPPSIMIYPLAILSAVAMAPFSMAAPAGSLTRTSTSARSSPTVPYASNNPNFPLWSPQADAKIVPAPIRGPLGGKILGPQNIPLQMENPDALAAPSTDAGNVYVYLSNNGLRNHI